jgi:hypothetical protein
MAKFKSPRPNKGKAAAQQRARMIPCLVLIAMIFLLIGALFYAALRG